MAAEYEHSSDLWLWDGAAEYEGEFTRVDQPSFTARIRSARRGASTVGRRLSASAPDLQRLFTQRRFLAHVTGGPQGALCEAVIQSVQACGDGEYEYLLSGRFDSLDPQQLEMLSRLPVENVAALMQQRAS